MDIPFYKYQGTGNDFIMIDHRSSLFMPDETMITRWCDRRFGIGADGLILLEEEPGYDFRMIYFNADGRQSSMCGNGGRCAARFAGRIGLGGSSGEFIAIDGPHAYEMPGNGSVRLKMKDVTSIGTRPYGLIMDTGSPHCVQFHRRSDDLTELDVVDEARKIRYNEEFAAEGINVNFALEKDGDFFMRTYERGVENETLSCGTGTVATALAFALSDEELASPVPIRAPGGNLQVHFQRIADGFSDIWLEGPAEFVFEGRIQKGT